MGRRLRRLSQKYIKRWLGYYHVLITFIRFYLSKFGGGLGVEFKKAVEHPGY